MLLTHINLNRMSAQMHSHTLFPQPFSPTIVGSNQLHKFETQQNNKFFGQCETFVVLRCNPQLRRGCLYRARSKNGYLMPPCTCFFIRSCIERVAEARALQRGNMHYLSIADKQKLEKSAKHISRMSISPQTIAKLKEPKRLQESWTTLVVR